MIHPGMRWMFSSYNNHKSLSGIETPSKDADGGVMISYNNHKSLSGIETNSLN
jgi:hypothetical protein